LQFTSVLISSSITAEGAELDAATTALVMVDVWNSTDPVLLDNYEHRLLPLLAAARKLGFLVVHAPSEGPLLSNITVEAGELLVTGTDGEEGSPSRCDVAMKNTTRNIKHILLTGYDTNMCMIDKPCGAFQLSTSHVVPAEVILIRDVTRPQSRYYQNSYYSLLANTMTIETAPWLTPDPSVDHDCSAQRGIRSALLADLFSAFSLHTPLEPCQYPVESAAHANPSHSQVPFSTAASAARTAFVLVSAADDFANDGFQARVTENLELVTVPLLNTVRESALRVIHIPNGHHLSVAPVQGEVVVHSDTEMARAIELYSITSLVYCGYPANVDVMWGAGGIAKLYAARRYLNQSVPTAYWIEDCTVAFETAQTIEGQWAKKESIAYRQGSSPLVGVLDAAAITRALCEIKAGQAPIPSTPFFALEGEHHFSTPADMVVDKDINGDGCGNGGMLNHPNVTIELSLGASTLDHTLISDRKALCFVKSVGTPFAVYQLKVSTTLSAEEGPHGNSGAQDQHDLMYQASINGVWHTLTIPSALDAANQSTRLTIVHAGQSVAVYKYQDTQHRGGNRSGNRGSADGGSSAGTTWKLLSSDSHFGALDYSAAEAMAVGGRPNSIHPTKESWMGTVSDVTIRAGAYYPGPPGPGPSPPTPSPLLDPSEVAVLEEIYSRLGGNNWKYNAGTDVYNHTGKWMVGDPCADRWYGVKCQSEALSEESTSKSSPYASYAPYAHVVALFPNPRSSGNPLVGQLPDSIANLTKLQHLYTSNDVSPSSLTGTMPASIGSLSHLKCMYFSHNQLTGTIPRTFEQLTNLEAFLMRKNKLRGELINFSPLKALLNVWFDGQSLTGNLTSLGMLPNITLLHAENNLLSGSIPAHLCGVQCHANGNQDISCPLPTKGCCGVTKCSVLKPPTPAPPPSTMGECYPQ
jgi:hypothetical protein